MSVVEIVDHPLIQHKISLLRDRNTGTKEFRDLVSEIAMLLCYEATRDLPTEEVEVETPVALARTKVLAGRKLALVPILRAGLGMVDGMLNLIPAAKVGHIGMYRNEETLEPVEYYCKLPNDINEREVFVLDPMLATGGSACDAIGQIKKRGAKHIKFIGLVAAPHGSRPCYCTILLRAEDTVAGVAQAGDDVAVVVQLLVQGADIDVHIGVGLMQGLQALGRGHQADELNVLGTARFTTLLFFVCCFICRPPCQPRGSHRFALCTWRRSLRPARRRSPG